MSTGERTLYTTTAVSLRDPDRVRVGEEGHRELFVVGPDASETLFDEPAWNPEQMYAAAVASCLHQALALVASEVGVDTHGSRVKAVVSLEHTGPLRYSFSTTVSVDLPGVEPRRRDEVIAEALRSCPMGQGMEVEATP
ncbi:OsmC family protein [Streptomyces thermolineatus]|uniref:OsmC family protein n=1 Tax=Streptomyces thermolineatus TaxID=44033 RepID=A0ABP5ZYE5_9ACTN